MKKFYFYSIDIPIEDIINYIDDASNQRRIKNSYSSTLHVNIINQDFRLRGNENELVEATGEV